MTEPSVEPSGFVVRRAKLEDVPSINAILNYYIRESVMTFATAQHSTAEFTAKFKIITEGEQLPFFVATTIQTDQGRHIDETIVGYSYIAPYRSDRAAYRYTGELSLFVHRDYQAKGIGSSLLCSVLDAAPGTKFKELIVIMAVDNDGKAKGLGLRDFYVSRGFRKVGILKSVGWKFGKW